MSMVDMFIYSLLAVRTVFLRPRRLVEVLFLVVVFLKPRGGVLMLF